jgi:hypothetical protein
VAATGSLDPGSRAASGGPAAAPLAFYGHRLQLLFGRVRDNSVLHLVPELVWIRRSGSLRRLQKLGKLGKLGTVHSNTIHQHKLS